MNQFVRSRATGALVLAICAGSGALTSCGFDSASSSEAREATGNPPVTMTVVGSTATTEGVWRVHVEFRNPGADPVTVTSGQVHDGTTSWQEATVVVPAGSTEQMTIHGQGPQQCAETQHPPMPAQIPGATPPWQLGNVRADGEVVMPEEDVWC